MFAVVAGIFTWCLLWHGLRKRRRARRAELAAPVIVAWPPSGQPAWPPAPGPDR